MRLTHGVALSLVVLAAISPQIASSEPTGPWKDAVKACYADGGFVKTGRMSGLYAVALVMCGGGSTAGLEVHIFVQGRDCPGCGTYDLGEVSGGDHMSVFFAGGYAYVTGALHDFAGPRPPRSGECMQCYTHMLVHRLTAQTSTDQDRKVFVDKGIAVVDVSETSDYRYNAQHADFAPTARFVSEALRSADLIKSH